MQNERLFILTRTQYARKIVRNPALPLSASAVQKWATDQPSDTGQRTVIDELSHLQSCR